MIWGYARVRPRTVGAAGGLPAGGVSGLWPWPPRTGDVVTVTRIDRLDRPRFDLFAIVKQIVDVKAQFRSLAEPWADAGTSTGRLMIGGLADVERDLIRTRTAEGRERAEACGQHMGRPPKLTPQQQKEARRRRAEGATLKKLAKSYKVGRATISRLSA